MFAALHWPGRCVSNIFPQNLVDSALSLAFEVEVASQWVFGSFIFSSVVRMDGLFFIVTIIFKYIVTYISPLMPGPNESK